EVGATITLVIGHRGPEPALADNSDTMRIVETEYLRDVIAQVCDIIANAAHAKLAKVTKIFPGVRGVEIKLLGQRLRRNSFDPGSVKRIEAPQVNTQAAGC